MIPLKDFERDLADLEPDTFEQLVHAVVRRDHPNAQKIKAPDFGADVVDDPGSRRPRVWQVKHYPRPAEINWTHCWKSLDRAVTKWRPRKVTFVFPRDLTGKEHADFNDKLARHDAIAVTRWTASDLNDLLERHPAIRRSYFPHRTGDLHKVLRAAHLTHTPTDGPAFLEHGLNLAELTDELDPHFDYELRSRPEHLPQVSWDQPPFMSVRLRAGGNESVLAAWAKPEASPPEASWDFTDDDAGEGARRKLYAALARGEPVELSEGIRAHAKPAPTAIKAIYDHIEEEGLAEGRLLLAATPSDEAVPLNVKVGQPAPSARLKFAMRAAPPKPGDEGAWVGRASGIMLYLGFREPTTGSVTLTFSPTMELGTSAGANAAATATMLDLVSEPLRLEGPLVAGDAVLDLGTVTEPQDLERLQFLADVYAAMIEIEARTGIRLHVADVTEREAVDALNLANLLRERRATGTSQLKTTLHLPQEQVADVAMRLAGSRQITVPFEQDLMDQTVRSGWARLTFERLTTTLRPPEPGELADLRIEADGEVQLQLIDNPLPSDVAMDLVTGQWKTALAPHVPRPWHAASGARPTQR